MDTARQLSDLDAAFAALTEAAELEQSEDSARDAVRKYREACDRLDRHAQTLPATAPERALLINRRAHYRDRAKELSESLLPAAVAVDPAEQSSSDVPVADKAYYEAGGEKHPPPSAPLLEDSYGPDRIIEQDIDFVASKIDKADSLLNRATSMDNDGKKRSKVASTYVEAGELYLEAIRISEQGGGVADIFQQGGAVVEWKTKLNMILNRVEELQKADSSSDGRIGSFLNSKWICGRCG